MKHTAQIKERFMNNEVKFHVAINDVAKFEERCDAIRIVSEWGAWRRENAPVEFWIQIAISKIDRTHKNSNSIKIDFESGSIEFPRTHCTVYEVEDEGEATIVVDAEFAVANEIEKRIGSASSCWK